jgi:hypothetical protein
MHACIMTQGWCTFYTSGSFQPSSWTCAMLPLAPGKIGLGLQQQDSWERSVEVAVMMLGNGLRIHREGKMPEKCLKSKDRAHKLPAAPPASAPPPAKIMASCCSHGITFPKHVQLWIWEPSSLPGSSLQMRGTDWEHGTPQIRSGIELGYLRNKSVGTINRKEPDSFHVGLFLDFMQLSVCKLAKLRRQSSYYHSRYEHEFLRNNFLLSVELKSS